MLSKYIPPASVVGVYDRVVKTTTPSVVTLNKSLLSLCIKKKYGSTDPDPCIVNAPVIEGSDEIDIEGTLIA